MGSPLFNQGIEALAEAIRKRRERKQYQDAFAALLDAQQMAYDMGRTPQLDTGFTTDVPETKELSGIEEIRARIRSALSKSPELAIRFAPLIADIEETALKREKLPTLVESLRNTVRNQLGAEGEVLLPDPNLDLETQAEYLEGIVGSIGKEKASFISRATNELSELGEKVYSRREARELETAEKKEQLRYKYAIARANYAAGLQVWAAKEKAKILGEGGGTKFNASLRTGISDQFNTLINSDLNNLKNLTQKKKEYEGNYSFKELDKPVAGKLTPRVILEAYYTGFALGNRSQDAGIAAISQKLGVSPEEAVNLYQLAETARAKSKTPIEIKDYFETIGDIEKNKFLYNYHVGAKSAVIGQLTGVQIPGFDDLVKPADTEFVDPEVQQEVNTSFEGKVPEAKTDEEVLDQFQQILEYEKQQSLNEANNLKKLTVSKSIIPKPESTPLPQIQQSVATTAIDQAVPEFAKIVNSGLKLDPDDAVEKIQKQVGFPLSEENKKRIKTLVEGLNTAYKAQSLR